MNRKEAARLADKWYYSDASKDDVASLTSLLLRTYKKGVKDGIVLGAVAVTPPHHQREEEAVKPTKEPREKRQKLIDYVISGNNYKVTLREARMLDKAFRDGIEDGYKECAEDTIKLLNNGIGSLLSSLIQTKKP